MQKLYSFDPKKNKTILVGEVIGKTLVRKVNSNHFFRVCNGYGIQENAFEKAVEMGIKHITLLVDSTDVSWSSTVKDWIEHGAVKDYGHGKQRFLSMKYMNGKRTKDAPAVKEPEVVNVTLFDVLKNLPDERRQELKNKLGLK